MAIERKKQSMDGNTAAAHVSYAFTEVAAIYPITPSSVMAELTDAWSANGLKTLWARTSRLWKCNPKRELRALFTALWQQARLPRPTLHLRVFF